MIFTKKTSLTASLNNIQSFLDNTRGQITIGEIPPIRRAALAAQGKKARVALVARDSETVAELLQRLDVALGTAMAEDTVIDEVLPEIKRRRTP
ncbi:MAG TPA: hypothetical protein VN612_05280 [Acidobacteriaceae bacterium]|jgi:hypothetical protein|nr:hypothetical protein [Acidobacteriaceae bacterium]